MYLIVGLGNPEEEYANTRHNMGFEVINEISKRYDIEVNKHNFKGLMGTGIIENEKVILLKPLTYMNLSGESIKECMQFYKIGLDKLIVISDDIDIEKGIIRIRKKGSAGTHNGMKSVIHMLCDENFIRVRIGIGKPEESFDLIAHVIEKIDEEEKTILRKGINIGADAIEEMLKNGIDIAMNKFN